MRRVAPLVCALILLAPGVAGAQTTPGGLDDAPPLVDAPPVVVPEPEPAPAGDGDGEDPAARRTAPAEAGELPDTGADARFVAMLGLGLLLGGFGLRLRSTDERF